MARIEGPLKSEKGGCSLKNGRVGWLESRVRSKMKIEGPLKNESVGEGEVEG